MGCGDVISIEDEQAGGRYICGRKAEVCRYDLCKECGEERAFAYEVKPRKRFAAEEDLGIRFSQTGNKLRDCQYQDRKCILHFYERTESHRNSQQIVKTNLEIFELLSTRISN